MKSTTENLLLAITLVVTLVGCASRSQLQTIPEVTPSQSLPKPADLRNFRYCEIIPIFRRGLTFHVEIYNTLGQNDCPAALWSKLDEEAMAESYGAQAVKLNGPRYWVLNEVVGGGATATGKIVDFEGIEMKLVAVLETKLWKGTIGEALYTDNEVQRTTSWIYRTDNMVYELTSPEGDVYRMQSYSQIVDPNLTIDSLERLDEQLELPEGWRYEASRLTNDSVLKADGLAYVINDNLLNSYQKVTE